MWSSWNSRAYIARVIASPCSARAGTVALTRAIVSALSAAAIVYLLVVVGSRGPARGPADGRRTRPASASVRPARRDEVLPAAPGLACPATGSRHDREPR